MSVLKEPEVNWDPNQMVEVTLNEPDDFLKVRETLTRIGVASRKEKKIYQSCHILHKQGRYFLVHFKELFALDGKHANLTINDVQRRNRIAQLLADWGLISIVNVETIQDIAPLNQIKVLSFKEILSDSIFWILTIIFTLQLTANLGVYTHIPIFSQDLGYSPLQASWIYSVAAFHAAMGKIVFGRLLDNLGARRTIFISLLFHGLGIAILIFATNLFMLLIAVMIMGLGLGGTIPLMNSTFAIAFGNTNFGKARGLVGPFMVPMQITAAPLSGWLYDTYGNYTLAFSINVVLCIIAGIVVLFLHLPDRK